MTFKEDDTRSRILNAAGTAFAELGFEATTVRDICKRAGVNLASVNYHFGDKEQLYIESIQFAHRMRAEQIPLPEWAEDTPADVKLREFIHATVNRMLVAKELPWQDRLVMREMLQPTEACRKLAQECFRPHFEMLLNILDEIVPDTMPVHQRHQLAFSVVGQCLFYKFNKQIIGMLISESEIKRHFKPAQLADHITDVTLAALGQLSLFTGAETLPAKKKRKNAQPVSTN